MVKRILQILIVAVVAVVIFGLSYIGKNLHQSIQSDRDIEEFQNQLTDAGFDKSAILKRKAPTHKIEDPTMVKRSDMKLVGYMATPQVDNCHLHLSRDINSRDWQLTHVILNPDQTPEDDKTIKTIPIRDGAIKLNPSRDDVAEFLSRNSDIFTCYKT